MVFHLQNALLIYKRAPVDHYFKAETARIIGIFGFEILKKSEYEIWHKVKSKNRVKRVFNFSVLLIDQDAASTKFQNIQQGIHVWSWGEIEARTHVAPGRINHIRCLLQVKTLLIPLAVKLWSRRVLNPPQKVIPDFQKQRMQDLHSYLNLLFFSDPVFKRHNYSAKSLGYIHKFKAVFIDKFGIMNVVEFDVITDFWQFADVE